MEDTQRAYEEWLKAKALLEEEKTAKQKPIFCDSKNCPYYSKELIPNINYPNCPTLFMTHCKKGATGWPVNKAFRPNGDCPHPEYLVK